MVIIDSITYGFLTTMLSAGTDGYGIGDLSEDQINHVKAFVSTWINRDGVLDAIIDCHHQGSEDNILDHLTGVGHDLYLACDGQGGGFCSEDYNEYGEILVKSCEHVVVWITVDDDDGIDIEITW